MKKDFRFIVKCALFSVFASALIAVNAPARAAFATTGLTANWQGSALSSSTSTWSDSVNHNVFDESNTVYSSNNTGYLSFDGASSFVLMPTATTFQNTLHATTESLFMWIKPSSAITADAMLFSSNRTTSNIYGEQMLYLSPVGKLKFYNSTGGSTGFNTTPSSTTAVNFDSWNYVGITITNDGTNGILTFYINGAPAGTATISSSNISSCYLASFTLGYDQRGGGAWYKGAIGQVSFWATTPLTQSDVTNNYQSTYSNYFPPVGFSYSNSSQSLFMGVSLTTATPSFVDSAATTYSISPPLPAGVSFNSATGVISGKPTSGTQSPVSYTITATNPAGSTTTNFVLGVLPMSVITINIPAKAAFNQSTSILANVDSSNNNPVSFWANGKMIFHCNAIQPISQLATCNWKTNIHGMVTIYASQSSAGVTTGLSSNSQLMITGRMGAR